MKTFFDSKHKDSKHKDSKHKDSKQKDSKQKRNIALALFAGLAISLVWPAPAAAQAWPCSWPLEVTGTGLTNAGVPDTDATYWLMPIDTAVWKTMMVSGEYPKSRFFSFVTYLGNGSVVDSIIDANIAPDPGSTNPFMPGETGERQRYTLMISREQPAAGNHLELGSGLLGFVIYRVYVPDRGLNRRGGVPLPQVTLVSVNGVARRIPPCRFWGSRHAKRSLTQSLDALALAAQDVPSFASKTLPDPQTGNTCQPGQAEQSIVTFAKSSNAGSRPFSNPANTYLAAGGLCLEANKIVVIRGRGAVFPDTYNGSSIFQPAIAGDMQLRYWSMCNNDQQFPFPVVACQPDWATKLDEQGFFTYVVSQDESGMNPPTAPSWLPPEATWLPWGDPTIANLLLFRTMLPAEGFEVTGDYYPKGVFCDKELFVAQGWQACFAAAGETVH